MALPTRRKLLYAAGGTLLFLASFVVFAYWTFPYERLRDYIVQEVERPADSTGTRRPSGYLLEIRSLEPSFVTGVDLEGVRFVRLPATADGRPIVVEADTVHARVSLLSLLAGDVDVTFEAQLAGGSVEGALEVGDAQTHVEAEIRGVDVKRLGVLRGLIGLPATGVLGGTVNVTLAEETKNTTGDVDLTIDALSIGDGRAELRRRAGTKGLIVERIAAGKLAFELEIREGVARIAKLEANGPDIELEGSGTIRLAHPVRASRADVMLRVKIADAYKSRNDRTRGLFALMELDPELSAAQTPDGALQWRLEGTFGGRIRPTPAGRAPRRGAGRAPGAPRPPDDE